MVGGCPFRKAVAVAAAVGLPVWALGALVAAFAAAAIAVVAYWEPIKAFFARLWEGLGFDVHSLADFNSFARRQGVVHCIKKYLRRGD